MTAFPLALIVILAATTIALLMLWLRARRQIRQLEQQRQLAEQTLARGHATQGELERARAVTDERERIYADLHDDIGAKLLTLIYSSQEPAHADLARTVLQDLRDVVSRSRGVPGTLLDVLSSIRSESEHRLSVLEGGLDWEQAEDLPDPPLDHGQALHLFRIVREAISNALRHGNARRLRIRVRSNGKLLVLDVTDDGPGLADPPEGRGSDNMRQRAAKLQGTIAWDTGTFGGAKVVLQFPLLPAAGTATS